MQNLNDMWLRGQAAQHSFVQLAAYNAAFLGTASVQVMRAGFAAPQTFWSAMARATTVQLDKAPAPTSAPESKPKAKAAPKPTRKAKAAPVKVAPAPAKPEKAVAPVAKVTPKPATPKPTAKVKPDDLTQMKGVGATLAKSLNDAGIETFAQIAKLTPKRIDKLNETQQGFKMLAARYKLVEQAKALTK